MSKKRPSTAPITVYVGTITENSGVYISDRSVVFGISAHSKSNNGFGSVDTGNLIYGNMNLIYDSDFIDTPIDDRDIKIYQHQQNASTPSHTHVGFESINVATLTHNSGVFVGDVKITGFDAHTKENSAQGITHGNRNVEMQNLNYVYDSDVIDTPINDRDFKFLAR